MIARHTPCPTHVDPSKWVDEKLTDGRGWISTICEVCHTWIGYRPPENSKTKHPRFDDRDLNTEDAEITEEELLEV